MFQRASRTTDKSISDAIFCLTLYKADEMAALSMLQDAQANISKSGT
jgi:hypothetical protein